MYCCKPFENLILNAGGRGFSILICSFPFGNRFVIQMRSSSYADEESATIRMKHLDLQFDNLILSSSMIIKFCPCCGSKLSDTYSKHVDHYDDLLQKHTIFQNKW